MKIIFLLILLGCFSGCAGNFYCEYESRSEELERIVNEVERRNGEASKDE